MEKKQTYKSITQTDIDGWKKINAFVNKITVPLTDDLNGETAQFVVCKPTRPVLNMIIDYGKQENVQKVNEILIENCVLGGDMKYLSEDAKEGADTQVYLAVIEELGKLMTPRAVKSKRL